MTRFLIVPVAQKYCSRAKPRLDAVRLRIRFLCERCCRWISEPTGKADLKALLAKVVRPNPFCRAAIYQKPRRFGQRAFSDCFPATETGSRSTPLPRLYRGHTKKSARSFDLIECYSTKTFHYTEAEC